MTIIKNDSVFDERNERGFDEDKQVGKAARLFMTEAPPKELEVAGKNFTGKSVFPKRGSFESASRQGRKKVNTSMIK